MNLNKTFNTKYDVEGNLTKDLLPTDGDIFLVTVLNEAKI